MPELPEVETVRRGLAHVLTGATVRDVTVTGKRTIRRQEPEEFVALLRGRTITSAGRHGKYLLLALDTGATLVVHLRMSGQLRHVARAAALAPHTHVVIDFGDGTELRFVDPRTFGEMFVTEHQDDNGRPYELAGIGRDPLVDGLLRSDVAALLGSRKMALKAFLLDQRFIAGIGNIYADEICFVARLRPPRRTESLSAIAIGRLAKAVPQVLGAAVELGGSSLRDAQYRDLFGGAGLFQIHHAVYGRTGAPCPTCGTKIARVKIAGRSSHFCPKCQT